MALLGIKGLNLGSISLFESFVLRLFVVQVVLWRYAKGLFLSSIRIPLLNFKLSKTINAQLNIKDEIKKNNQVDGHLHGSLFTQLKRTQARVTKITCFSFALNWLKNKTKQVWLEFNQPVMDLWVNNLCAKWLTI